MPELTSFIELVNVAAERTVKLSGGSLTVLLSALDLINSADQWQGSNEDFTLTDAEKDLVEGYIDTAIYELLKVAQMRTHEVGEPFPLFVPDAPDGALAMDGRAVLLSQYPLLAEKVPNGWVSGAFINLPNMATRGLFGVGAGTNGFEVFDGETFGEDFHTLTTLELPSHAHTVKRSNSTQAGDASLFQYGRLQQGLITTESTGSDQPHNNMPPGIGVYWFIQAE